MKRQRHDESWRRFFAADAHDLRKRRQSHLIGAWEAVCLLAAQADEADLRVHAASECEWK